MADSDILKMDKITKLKVSQCFNWLSYTKELELEQERRRTSN